MDSIFLTLLIAILGIGINQQITPVYAAPPRQITADKVTNWNVDGFIEQVHRDLPIGTNINDVNKYIELIKLTCRYIGEYTSLPEFENYYYCSINDIGNILFYTVGIYVFIFFDEFGNIKEVRIRKTYL